jgi:hypothetical protein
MGCGLCAVQPLAGLTVIRTVIDAPISIIIFGTKSAELLEKPAVQPLLN